MWNSILIVSCCPHSVSDISLHWARIIARVQPLVYLSRPLLIGLLIGCLFAWPMLWSSICFLHVSRSGPKERIPIYYTMHYNASIMLHVVCCIFIIHVLVLVEIWFGVVDDDTRAAALRFELTTAGVTFGDKRGTLERATCVTGYYRVLEGIVGYYTYVRCYG